jgi:DNA-directed RNA polymerase specialized sigma24 family protein
MNFKELLEDAKISRDSAEKLIEMYRPMLTKASVLKTGVFDEDLYQENIIVLLRCIRTFKI